MNRSGALACIGLPLACLAWPLVAPQQSPPSQEGEAAEFADREVAPLVSELTGRPLPPVTRFGVADRPNSAPVLVPTADGAWLVALEWEPGRGDRIVVRALLPSGEPVKRRDGAEPLTALVVDPVAHEILQPAALLDAQRRLVVAWTEVGDDGSVLRAARLDGPSFTPAVTLTAPALHARSVALALHEGRVWCCFEARSPPPPGSDKGGFDVLLAPLGAEKLGEPARVGDGRFSDADPVAASSGGKLWVAWSRYGGRDYEVVLRSFEPKAALLGEPLDVSADSDSDDLHPTLVAGANGELWLAWDRLCDPTRGTSMPRLLRDVTKEPALSVYVMSACVRDGQVLLPEGRCNLPPGVVVGAPQFSWTGGLPALAIDATGRPWLAYRYLLQGQTVGSRSGYPVVAHRWNGAGWSAPVELADTYGPIDPPALGVSGHGALVVALSDHHFESSVKMKLALDAARFDPATWQSAASLLVTAVPESTATGGAAAEAKLLPRVEHLARPHFHPAAEAVEDPYVSGARHFVVEQGGRRYQVLWGDLHRHSCVSKCTHGMEERPLQRWDFGRDVHLYDFMALTDHSDHMDPASWWLEDKLVRLERTPELCTLAGYEWSTQQYGHQNVILAGRLAPVASANYSDPGKLFRRLTGADAIVIPHGTADQGRSAEFERWDDRMNTLVEVYQAMRGNSEFDGCVRQSKSARVDDCFVQDALAAGHQFGLIASTDHGSGCAYAVALAERLDVASLMEAFRARRTYAATTKGMLVDFRIDDHLMGEAIRCAGPPHLQVKVRGAAELAELVVFRDGSVFQSLGRATTPRGGRIDVTVRMDLTQTPKEGDLWRLRLTAPGCTLERVGDDIRRNSPHKPPYPRWRAKEGEAVFVWPDTFAPDRLSHEYRVVVQGAADSRLTLEWDEEKREVALSDLLQKPVEGESPRGPFRITATQPPDAQVDLSKGLGVRELVQEWADTDAAAGNHWYYARAIQVDGEMVWSSPIFVTRG